MNIKIKRINPEAKLPEYAHNGDAGMDLFSVIDAKIRPKHRLAVPTGIEIEIPNGYVGLVWDKSGISLKEGIKTMAGVIDSSYRGEIKIVVINLGSKVFKITKGMKIAQMLIQPIITAKIKEAGNLAESKRGRKGFGSTGR